MRPTDLHALIAHVEIAAAGPLQVEPLAAPNVPALGAETVGRAVSVALQHGASAMVALLLLDADLVRVFPLGTASNDGPVRVWLLLIGEADMQWAKLTAALRRAGFTHITDRANQFAWPPRREPQFRPPFRPCAEPLLPAPTDPTVFASSNRLQPLADSEWKQILCRELTWSKAMSVPIHSLSIETAVSLINASPKRAQVLVDQTETRAFDFCGVPQLEQLRKHCRDQGLGDVPYHFAIDGDGKIYSGRLLALEQSGATSAWLILLIGCFTEPNAPDPFGGAAADRLNQLRDAMLGVGKANASNFLPFGLLSMPEFGNDTSLTSGSELNKKRFTDAADPVEPLSTTLLHQTKSAALLAQSTGLPSNPAPARFFYANAWKRTALQTRGAVDPRFESLNAHVVNLSAGVLSSTGRFTSTPTELKTLIAAGIRREAPRLTANGTRPLKLMVHAHGGLVNEESALEYAESMRQYWLGNGVYPLFVVWESGLLEVFKQALGKKERGLSDVVDAVSETIARPLGRSAWTRMKRSAELASRHDPATGHVGGMYLLALMIKSISDEFRNLELHLVGHSAGSILHRHWLDVLVNVELKTTSLSFLAPAISIEEFERGVKPRIGTEVEKFAVWTMDDERERDDNLFPPLYWKSLLYLVRNAFETERKAPIFGLQRDLKQHGWLEWFRDNKTLNLSSDNTVGAPETNSCSHGCFDNDPATLISVWRFIASQPDGSVPPAPPPEQPHDCKKAQQRALCVRDFVASRGAFAVASPVGLFSLNAQPGLVAAVRKGLTPRQYLREILAAMPTGYDQTPTLMPGTQQLGRPLLAGHAP